MIEFLVVLLALGIDLAVGDPKNRFHPTSWIGRLIGRIAPYGKTGSPATERLAGVVLVVSITCAVLALLFGIGLALSVLFLALSVLFLALSGLPEVPAALGIMVSVVYGAVLLKATIAVRGMEQHAMRIADHVGRGDIGSARACLSMIVKRDTKDLDEGLVLSGAAESVSENTVDGITGPLFYFGLASLPGAFAYRTINTFDSMIGYRTAMFANLGWFAAISDRILNYVPSRLTALVMILASAMLGYDWRRAARTVIRDGSKPDSPNAGYPMAAMAGALGTTFEKPDHYTIGCGGRPEIRHIRQSVMLMKVTALLFCCTVTVPIILAMSYLGWWLHV